MPWPITLPFVKSTLTVALEIYIFGVLMDSGVYVILVLSVQENRSPSTFFRDVTEKNRERTRIRKWLRFARRESNLRKRTAKLDFGPRLIAIYGPEDARGQRIGPFLEIFRSSRHGMSHVTR